MEILEFMGVSLWRLWQSGGNDIINFNILIPSSFLYIFHYLKLAVLKDRNAMPLLQLVTLKVALQWKSVIL